MAIKVERWQDSHGRLHASEADADQADRTLEMEALALGFAERLREDTGLYDADIAQWLIGEGSGAVLNFATILRRFINGEPLAAPARAEIDPEGIYRAETVLWHCSACGHNHCAGDSA